VEPPRAGEEVEVETDLKHSMLRAKRAVSKP